MTYEESLFLRTLEDIEGRVKSADPYDVLMLSGLIRKLFIDADPLVHQANRTHRLKLRFVITDPDDPYTRAVLAHKPTFYSLADGLDPDTSRPGKGTITVNLDGFLGARVLVVAGASYSVRDVITFQANVMGAMHSGSPITDKDKVLTAVNDFYVGQMPAALSQVRAISRVTLKALRPLRDAIQDAST